MIQSPSAGLPYQLPSNDNGHLADAGHQATPVLINPLSWLPHYPSQLVTLQWPNTQVRAFPLLALQEAVYSF